MLRRDHSCSTYRHVHRTYARVQLCRVRFKTSIHASRIIPRFRRRSSPHIIHVTSRDVVIHSPFLWMASWPGGATRQHSPLRTFGRLGLLTRACASRMTWRELSELAFVSREDIQRRARKAAFSANRNDQQIIEALNRRAHERLSSREDGWRAKPSAGRRRRSSHRRHRLRTRHSAPRRHPRPALRFP